MHLTTYVKTGVAALALAFALPAGAATPLDKNVTDALPLVTKAYTYLHENPELGKKEVKAHDYLMAQMKALGYTQFVASKLAPTAVIAVLDTGRPGPVIALRSEMDARPLPEGVNEPDSHTPRSQVPGVMHNCGHDIHAAILLGTASILMREKAHLNGKLVILFQPAEETAGGADDIVNEHILDDLKVSQIFAEHVAPGLPVGQIGVGDGAILAGSNYFTLKIEGKGSHAAYPSAGDDVLLGAMRIAQDISYAPARRFDIANRPVIVSITRFNGDSGASNVLPPSATMSGTIRAFENLKQGPDGQPSIEAELTHIIDADAKVSNLTYDWSLRQASPPTLNNHALYASLVPVLSARYPGKIVTDGEKGMASEDFAYYTAHIPSLYFSLGVAKDGLGEAGVHTVDFTASPEAFRYGLSLMTLIGELELGSPKPNSKVH